MVNFKDLMSVKSSTVTSIQKFCPLQGDSVEKLMVGCAMAETPRVKPKSRRARIFFMEPNEFGMQDTLVLFMRHSTSVQIQDPNSEVSLQRMAAKVELLFFK